MSTFISILLLIYNYLGVINSRPDGAPIEACVNMIPSHQGIHPLSIPAPFVVVTDKNHIKPGETLTVSLATNPDKFRYFKGFLVIAVDPENFLKKIGTFATNNEKYVACGPSPYSAVTHSSAQPKAHVELTWTAPKDYEGSVIFIATFVENFANFWIGQQSALILVSPSSVRPTKHELPTTTALSHLDLLTSNHENNVVYRVLNPENLKLENIYEDCGINKGCYGEPLGCTTTRNCLMLVTFRRHEENIHFELMGPNEGYVALGFSKDRQMGDDSVIECVENPLNGVVDVFTSFNRGRSNSRLQMVKGGLINTKGASIDGRILCSFTRFGNVAVEGTSFDLIHNGFYLFLARGNVDRRAGDAIQQHSSIPFRSSRLVDLNSVDRVVGDKDTLIYIHGCLMIFAWIGTVSVALFIARFYKYTWVQTMHCGQQVWFTWHRALNFLTIALTTLGIVLIFVFIGGWSATWRENPHPIIGLLTFVLMWIQPISAFFRPEPGTPKRAIFNWIHFIIGNLTKFLALTSLFLADKLTRISLLNSFSGVLITYIVFEFGCYFIMEVYSCIKAYSAREQIPLKEIQIPSSLNTENLHQKNVDAPGSKFRKLFFCIHSIGITSLTLTLIIIVASSSDRIIEKK